MREHPMEKENPFDPDLVHEIFKLVWKRKAAERENELSENMDNEVGASSSKRSRPSFEAIQRAATIAEAEGSIKIDATHLERILPQLLLDF